MKLRLYNVKNRYSFSIDGFSSLHHSFLIPGLYSSYQYAWQAYKAARKLALNSSCHVLALKKYAAEDLTQPLVLDASGEEQIYDHYVEVLKILDDRSREAAKDTKNKKLGETVYKEIKNVVTELLAVKQKMEDEKNKKQIDHLIASFREMVGNFFSRQLAKDIAQKKKEANAPPPTSLPATTEDPNAQLPQSPQAPTNQPPIAAPVTAENLIGFEKIADLNDSDNLDLDVVKEMIEEYGDRVCRAIEKKHPGAICKISHDNSTIDIVESDNSSNILRVTVNKNLNVDKIIPLGELSEIFPLNSLEFYQRYWKPIAESVGHFFIDDLETIFVSKKYALPDIPKTCPCSYDLKGWNTKSKKEIPIVLVFKGNDPVWGFDNDNSIKKNAASVPPTEYTEEDFIKGCPKRVRCVDEQLKSIYLMVGEVVQVIPLENHIELDVNFGRLIVRLTSDQIQIVN